MKNLHTSMKQFAVNRRNFLIGAAAFSGLAMTVSLIVHLGDYIYEGGPTAGRTRIHNSPEIMSLEDYRNRYALYKSDPIRRYSLELGGRYQDQFRRSEFAGRRDRIRRDFHQFGR